MKHLHNLSRKIFTFDDETLDILAKAKMTEEKEKSVEAAQSSVPTPVIGESSLAKKLTNFISTKLSLIPAYLLAETNDDAQNDPLVLHDFDNDDTMPSLEELQDDGEPLGKIETTLYLLDYIKDSITCPDTHHDAHHDMRGKSSLFLKTFKTKI
jgi:hypothetical protein